MKLRKFKKLLLIKLRKESKTDFKNKYNILSCPSITNIIEREQI